MQPAYDPLDVPVGQAQVRKLDLVTEHGHAMEVTSLRAFGLEPHVHYLFRQSGTDKPGPKRQDIGIVMLAAVAGTGQVVGHCRPDARNLVRCHARTDTCTVNHDADICCTP